MASYTSGEIATTVSQELKGLATNFEDIDYTNAAASVVEETSWTFPVTTNFKIRWSKERMKRHLLWMLTLEATEEFQYKKIYLNQKFDHLKGTINKMDRDFARAIKDNLNEFLGVNVEALFGTLVRAGFTSDFMGRDTTYRISNTPHAVPDDIE